MPCEKFKEDLQAYFDGELAPPHRAALETHLRDCEACNRVAAELQTVSNVLSHWVDRAPSDKFDFMVKFKVSAEEVPGADTTDDAAPAGAAREARARRSPKRRLVTGWLPAVAAAGVLLLFVFIVAMQNRPGAKRYARPRSVTDMLRAFMAAGPGGPVADACIYAASASKKAIEAEKLEPARVASTDVVYSFLVSAQSHEDKSAGWRLINLLSRRDRLYRPTRQATGRSLLAEFGCVFGRDLYAVGEAVDVLAQARRYEFQGRLREALARYAELAGGADAGRARLASGALKLRMGELDGAAESLEAAAVDPDAVIRSSVLALLAEIETARKARGELPGLRQSAKTAAAWLSVGLFEVRAYDFRSAANSFMKAANASAENDRQLHDEARFKSAWCQKEIGQISTAVYGFRSIAGSAETLGELEYSAAIEEAVALARVGRFDESVAVCRSLLKTQAPTNALEALAYFHKGSIELRHLGDVNAAHESLGRVASDGQGNLSYAAQCLLQAGGR